MRLMVPVFLAILVSAPSLAADGKYCKKMDSDGYCRDATVVYKLVGKEINVLKIALQFNSKTVITFPDGLFPLQKPGAGNERFLDISPSREGGYLLTIKPVMPDDFRGSDMELAGFKTNIPLFLPNKTNLDINVQLVTREEPGVRFVEITYPEFETQQKEKQRAHNLCNEACRGEWEKKLAGIDQTVEARMPLENARHKRKAFSCTGMREVNRVDLVSLWAFRLCREGDFLYLWILIRNNSRTDYTLDKLEIFAENSGTKEPLEVVGVDWEGGSAPKEMGYKKSKDGVVAIKITKQKLAKSYRAIAHELGGGKRIVELEIGF